MQPLSGLRQRAELQRGGQELGLLLDPSKHSLVQGHEPRPRVQGVSDLLTGFQAHDNGVQKSVAHTANLELMFNMQSIYPVDKRSAKKYDL